MLKCFDCLIIPKRKNARVWKREKINFFIALAQKLWRRVCSNFFFSWFRHLTPNVFTRKFFDPRFLKMTKKSIFSTQFYNFGAKRFFVWGIFFQMILGFWNNKIFNFFIVFFYHFGAKRLKRFFQTFQLKATTPKPYVLARKHFFQKNPRFLINMEKHFYHFSARLKRFFKWLWHLKPKVFAKGTFLLTNRFLKKTKKHLKQFF